MSVWGADASPGRAAAGPPAPCLQRACSPVQGAVSGSVQATDRLMKELRDIYRSQSFKGGECVSRRGPEKCWGTRGLREPFGPRIWRLKSAA